MLISGLPVDAKANRGITGEWSPTIYLQSRAVHMTLLKGVGGSHSKILWWPENNDATTSARAWNWNPGQPLPPWMPPEFPLETNLFCAGHSILANGDLMVSGGTEKGDVGIRGTKIFSRAMQAWTTGPNMKHDRWYPTNTALPNGDVLISAGWEQTEAIVYGGKGLSGELNSSYALKMRLTPAWNSASLPPDLTPGTRSFHSGADILGHGYYRDSCTVDEKRFITLIYGGERGAQFLEDLWGLKWNYNQNQYQWEDLTPLAGSVGPLCRQTAIYDPEGHAMYLYGGLAGPSQISGAVHRLIGIQPKFSDCNSPNLDWETLSFGLNPPARYGHNAMYDAVHRRMIVFGGRGANQLFNDVWLLHLDGTPTWEGPLPVINSPQVPEGRWGAQAAFDTTDHVAEGFGTKNNRLLVFGGYTGTAPLVPVTNTLWSGTIIESTPQSPTTKIQWEAYPLMTGDICPTTVNQIVINNTPAQLPAPRADGFMIVQEEPYARVMMYGGTTDGSLLTAATDQVWELDLGYASCGKGWLSWSNKTVPTTETTAGARFGHSMAFDTRPRTALYPEIYRASSSVPTVDLLNGSSFKKWLFSYPLMHLLPNGNVFYAGVDNRTHVLNLNTEDQTTDGWGANIACDFHGDTSVMMPVTGGTQVMKCGQKINPGTSQDRKVGTILFNSGGNGAWLADEETYLNLETGRRDANLTILPDATVLLTGGVEERFGEKPPYVPTGRRRPIIWSPVSRTWNSAPGQGDDQTILPECPNIRDYHSVALLLPDGTVFSAGGEDERAYTLPSTVPDGPNRRLTGEIYSPPYLFDSSGNPAVRPVIVSTKGCIGYGLTFTVTTSGTAPVTLALIRPGSVTHGVHQEQRYVPVTINSTTIVGGNLVVTAQGPADGRIAPPGYYLLFALSAAKVPSYASWVQIGPSVQTTTILTNETWYPEQGARVLTDELIIPSDRTLELRPGVEIAIAGGVIPAPRITVAGHLKIIGTAQNRVQVGTDAVPGSWEGIDVVAGGRVTVQYADIKNAATGIDFLDLNLESIQIQNSAFEGNLDYDIHVERSTYTNVAFVSITNCQFMVGFGTGVFLKGFMTHADISGNSFYGTGGQSGSTSGLHFDDPFNISVPTIRENLFTGFSSGQGVKLVRGRASLRGNTFTASKYGAYVSGGDHVFGPVLFTEMGNFFLANTNAGVHLTGAATGGVFRKNLFNGNYNGAVTQLGAHPNFSDAEWGHNSFLASTSKCLWNRSSNEIKAENCFWEYPCEDTVSLPACVVGLIDELPMLCTSPLSSAGPNVGTEAAPRSDVPLTLRTGSIVRSFAEFEVLPNPVAWLEIRIYDVLGRMRASLPLASHNGAPEVVRWTPRDSRGAGLAKGLYFATVWNGRSESRATRLILLEGGASR